MLWCQVKQVMMMNQRNSFLLKYFSLDYINVRKSVPESCRHPVSGKIIPMKSKSIMQKKMTNDNISLTKIQNNSR